MNDSLREEPRILVSGVNVVRSDHGEPQEGGSARSRDVSLGILPVLSAQLQRAAQEDNPAEVKVPPDAGTWGPPVAPGPGMSARSPVLGAEPVMAYFSCGRPGHRVNRCSQVATFFPRLVSGGETSIVEKWNGYSGDLVVQRQDQEALLPGDELNTRPVCVPSVGVEKTNRQERYRNSVPPGMCPGRPLNWIMLRY